MKKNTTSLSMILSVLAFCSLAQITSSTNSVVQKIIEAFPEVSVSTVRLVSTLPSLSGFIATLLVGMVLGKQMKYKTNVLLGCFLMGIGGIMPAVFDKSIVLILVGRFIAGVAMGCISCYNTIVISCFDESSRDRMLGIAGMTGSIGSIIWTQLAGILGDIQWQYASYVYAAALVIFVLEIFLFKEPEHAVPAAAEEGNKTKMPVITGRILFIMAAYGIMCLCAFPLCIGISTFLAVKEMGSAALAGTILAFYTIGGAVGGALYNTVVKILGRFTLAVNAVLIGVGYFLIIYGGSVFAAGLGTFLCGAAFFLCIPLFMSYVSYELAPERIALGVSLVLACGQIGMFFSGYWISVADKIIPGMFGTDVERAFFCAAIVFIAIGIVSAVIDPRPKQLKSRV